jgi:tRNA(Ile)-lysidine synthase
VSITTPSTILSSVRTYARAHNILRPGPIVLAVSGGSDSTALSLVLAELREEFGLVLHVAHFDHRARPRAAAADAAFVAELANHIGATLRVGRADTAPMNEAEARNARYEFLRRVARDLGATAVATGHTRDDQAETVLLHLSRGTGLAGLAGMRPERDGIVRPLLAIGRADTTAVCAAAGIAPHEDATNRSLRFARNRIRHRVLPELAKLNPEIAKAIARLADSAATVADMSAERAAAVLEGATKERATKGGAAPVQSAETSGAAASERVDAPDAAGNQGADASGAVASDDTVALDRLPNDDARAAALALWWERRTGRRLTARHRSALAQLVASTDGSETLDLPGGRALREYATLRVAPLTDNTVGNGPITLERGQTADWHGWRIALDVDLGAKAQVGYVDAERVVVRGRRPGDRMIGPGRAKVQDVFTDAKVPARERDQWPLVLVDDMVRWIPGITPPPPSGRSALRALRMGDDSLGVTLGNREQVASLKEQRPRGTERGRPRT